MQRYSVALLIALAIAATFWAYLIADSLITEFHESITFVDLGALFVLGLIAGVALGLIPALRRRGPRTHET
jgi:hypothetical protein